MPASKKPVARNSVIANSINSAVNNLESALEKANKAVTARSAESKKLLNESRRLRKRHAAQMKESNAPSQQTRRIQLQIHAKLLEQQPLS